MDLPMQQAAIMSATEPPTAPERESHNSFLILVLIVSLVISTIAVFLFWQNQQLRNQLSIATTSPSPTPSPASSAQPDNSATPTATNNAKNLTYKLPTNWKTAQDSQSNFQIGYDPNKYNVSTENNFITFNSRTSPGSFSFLLLPYDGSSRHTFIYKQQGYDSTPTDNRLSGYHEQEYSYQGWNCLVLYRLSFSSSGTTWGVCPVSSTQAIYFGGPEEQTEMESILSTLKLVK